MSIISKIPDNSRVRYPVARFESDPLDGLGQYVWENAANLSVPLIPDLNPANVYLVERVSFFANVGESDWLESMLLPINFPSVSTAFADLNGLLIGGSSIYAGPFRCVNYVDNSEQLLYFRGLQNSSQLVASMFGTVKQVPGMVGLLTLLAQINFTIYEITDKSWIRSYERDPNHLGATVRI